MILSKRFVAIPARLLARGAITLLVTVGAWGCAREEQGPTAPNEKIIGGSVVSPQQPDLDSALAVHRRHTIRLIAIPGVVGTAVGLTAARQPAIRIYTKTDRVAGLPDNLEGIPVDVQVTGDVFALPAQGGVTASTCEFVNCTTTSSWPTPVPTGVSTGANALLQGQCSAGTVGARVKAGSALYALSNNHVFALENTVAVGTNVLQPGLFDSSPQCSGNGSTAIGTLFAFDTIAFCGASCPNNTIDAAIAVTDATRLDNWTAPDGYGVPNSVTRAPALGLSVQKYGRTTGLTAGQVTGIDGTVTVTYDTGCPDACATAHFLHQVVMASCSGACSGPGDSGSLWVTSDASKNPVALLFAGNADGTVTWGNPIDSVLTHFGVTVDNSPAPTASGGLTACTPGGFPYTACGGDSQITSITASGDNSITVTDKGGHTGTITFSGATASGGLSACTPGGFPYTACGGDSQITSITASGSNSITVTDNGGHTGAITLSGATASGGLSACTPGGFPYTACGGDSQINAVTGSGSKWISLTDNGGHVGYIRLSF